MSLINLVPRTPGCCQEWGLRDSKKTLEIAGLPGQLLSDGLSHRLLVVLTWLGATWAVF